MGSDLGKQKRVELAANLTPNAIKLIDDCNYPISSVKELTFFICVVRDEEIASIWNLFETLQARSTDAYGLDKDVFFAFTELTVRNCHPIAKTMCCRVFGH